MGEALVYRCSQFASSRMQALIANVLVQSGALICHRQEVLGDREEPAWLRSCKRGAHQFQEYEQLGCALLLQLIPPVDLQLLLGLCASRCLRDTLLPGCKQAHATWRLSGMHSTSIEASSTT